MSNGMHSGAGDGHLQSSQHINLILSCTHFTAATARVSAVAGDMEIVETQLVNCELNCEFAYVAAVQHLFQGSLSRLRPLDVVRARS